MSTDVSSGDRILESEFDAGRLPAAPVCPVDRIPSRQRNRLFVQIILVGGLNFAAFTVTYAIIGGDAPNGHSEIVQTPEGPQVAYYVRGHFLRTLDGKERRVSRALWIYSYLHSITLPLTSGAMIISMLMLARPHILATMRDGRTRGPRLVLGGAVAVGAFSLFVATLFTWGFLTELDGR
ncbi:MAG: hypothetical protein D6744_05160 [Planctomycetota bacterium]|nr:MAG: hypothetical protein D6744_05160 [Planctomycetota bacterium]